MTGISGRRLPCAIALFALPLALVGCSKGCTGSKSPGSSELKIGLVTDVGGRGDQSFNDGALRGLETWASGKRYTTRGYEALPVAELAQTIPDDLRASGQIKPLGIEPVVLQA
ncbi:MAG: hypothetical protein HY901_00855, partial [Deltaproteobacteria bacterium]|nr:hypothetical protein [Deltaproteobacteria bacterium]